MSKGLREALERQREGFKELFGCDPEELTCERCEQALRGCICVVTVDPV